MRQARAHVACWLRVRVTICMVARARGGARGCHVACIVTRWRVAFGQVLIVAKLLRLPCLLIVRVDYRFGRRLRWRRASNAAKLSHATCNFLP